MATVLTVHGTFATGPDEGTAWWQRGSMCSEDIQRLVETEDGPVKVVPVVWDGLNSERSRQAAAAKLLDRIEALEKSGEIYCVIGHSHGGSVISASLLRAAYYKRPLDKLSRWVTIGTPFIEARRSRLLFARLGPFGKTVFLSALASFFGILLSTVPQFRFDRSMNYHDVSLSLYLIAIAVAMCLAIGYPILWLLARKRLHWHDQRAQATASKMFATRWLGLRHMNDEAVQGLGAFQSMKYPIFPKDFAVTWLSSLAVLVIPFAVYFAFTAFYSAMLIRDGLTADEPKVDQTTPEPKAAQAPVTTPVAPPVKTGPAPVPDTDEPSTLPKWTFVPIIIFGIGLFIGIPAGLYYLFYLAARPVSTALSIGLNRLTWSQIRMTSLGSDIDGESALRARASPTWIDTPGRPLPAALAVEIAAVSDAAAGKSIGKFRGALSELGFYRLEQGGRDTLNAFLCGDELIHTTYFQIPRFRKLLAYTIAQSPGFRPSAALRNDPDFGLIKAWYDELAGTPGTTKPQSM